MKTEQLANDLRIIAAALDKEPGIEVNPYMNFSAAYVSNSEDEKASFLALARIWPRPAKKGVGNAGTSYETFDLMFDGWAKLSIDRSKVCIMVRPAVPAKYECPNILTPEEEETLGDF